MVKRARLCLRENDEDLGVDLGSHKGFRGYYRALYVDRLWNTKETGENEVAGVAGVDKN